MTDEIPKSGEWRGVPLHAGQPESRLVVVRRDIDAAHALSDLDALVDFADDAGKAPEARLFAKAKALALLDDAVERRAPRSRSTMLDRQRVKASACGLDSMRWRSRTHYCSLLDGGPRPGEDRRVCREVPLE